jgi:hypothetical protein
MFRILREGAGASALAHATWRPGHHGRPGKGARGPRCQQAGGGGGKGCPGCQSPTRPRKFKRPVFPFSQSSVTLPRRGAHECDDDDMI